jgi:hypothetical protein
MSTIIPSPLLRQALLSDAVTTIACALLMLFGAGFLDPLLGLPANLLRTAGFILVPYAAWVAYLGTREGVQRVLVWAVVAVNALWTLDSILLLVSGWVAPTPAGYAFVIAQAAVVALYAELQAMGLKRSAAAMA